jgi:hypothetical protein
MNVDRHRIYSYSSNVGREDRALLGSNPSARADADAEPGQALVVCPGTVLTPLLALARMRKTHQHNHSVYWTGVTNVSI